MPISLFPPDPAVWRPNVISLYSKECLGVQLSGLATTAPASAAWAVANGALYIPLELPEDFIVTRVAVFNGGTAAANFDIAIYNDQLVRLVTAGSTAQVGTSVLQAVDVTDTYLAAGRYTVGITKDDAVGTFLMATVSIELAKLLGVSGQATAFPLPNPAVPASVVTHTRLPVFMLSGRSFV